MKIRVLEVLATLKRAGAERVAVTLAQGLDRARFECELVSLYDAFPGGFESELAGISAHHLGKHRGFDWRMYPRLAGVMRAFRPSIVHTHSYVLRYAWPVSRGTIVHTVHNLADREVDRIGRWLHRAAMRRGVRSVAIGSEVARSFRAVYDAEPDAIIPNGVDLPQPTISRDEWRRANGFGRQDLLIASVARLDPQKNPRLLIEALPSGAHLLLVGDGELRHDLKGERVHLMGVRTDVAELLAASDIFALASDYEGMPVAMIEAMAAGLPVVATAVGGVPELVEHEHSGLLAPPRDRAALAGALTAMVDDAERRRVYGERGRERAREFSAERMIAGYAALFERIVGK